MTDEVVKVWNRNIGEPQNLHATGNAIHTIDEEDAAIHQGESYHFGKKLYLAPGSVAMLAASVGASKRVHFQTISISATTGPIEVDFYRDCSISSGTQETPTNRRFDITSSSEMDIFSNVTLSNSGTLVVPAANLALPSDSKNMGPDEGGFFHGFVLDVNKTYVVGMKNLDTSTATIWANFMFHEPSAL